MVVDRNFKPRSVLCDTALVKALCSVSSEQHMKKLLSLRDGLHVMVQFFMQQHFADRCQLHEHPGGHASWREPTMRKFSKESTTCFVCSDGTFRRCNQNQPSMYVKQLVSSQTVGESKLALPELFKHRLHDSLVACCSIFAKRVLGDQIIGCGHNEPLEQ